MNLDDLMARATDERYRIVTVSSRELRALLKQRADALDALENLETQGLRDVVSGWVCVPEVEWNANMIVLQKLSPTP